MARALASSGYPLDATTRANMESRFGTDLGHVRVHTGSRVESLSRDLGANAFTQGADIFYGNGHVPGNNAVTAHEIVHAIQQSGGSRNAASGPITALSGERPIQRDTSYIGPYGAPPNGHFLIDLETMEKAPDGNSGMKADFRFIPAAGAKNSNRIHFFQVARATDRPDKDVLAGTPEEQGQRGKLGTPGLFTEEDPKRNIEGGYGMDVPHTRWSGGPVWPRGSRVPPHYANQPLSVSPPAGGPRRRSGDVAPRRAIPGFKRSDDPADIRSASMYDCPGTSLLDRKADFSFETVVRGEDVGFTYGVVTWGFHVENGKVSGQRLAVGAGGPSATFNEALERHRDFYVHEPMLFYFKHGSAFLGKEEKDKIPNLVDYLNRKPNADVTLSISGTADISGGDGAENRELSQKRAEAVLGELLRSHIARKRVTMCRGFGTSTAASSGPQADRGGDRTLGEDQSREANRWTNRRAMIVFSHAGLPDE